MLYLRLWIMWHLIYCTGHWAHRRTLKLHLKGLNICHGDYRPPTQWNVIVDALPQRVKSYAFVLVLTHQCVLQYTVAMENGPVQWNPLKRTS